jgi:hypothetical protein
LEKKKNTLPTQKDKQLVVAEDAQEVLPENLNVWQKNLENPENLKNLENPENHADVKCKE